MERARAQQMKLLEPSGPFSSECTACAAGAVVSGQPWAQDSLRVPLAQNKATLLTMVPRPCTGEERGRGMRPVMRARLCLPQGLCTCCLLCLEHSSPDFCIAPASPLSGLAQMLPPPGGSPGQHHGLPSLHPFPVFFFLKSLLLNLLGVIMVNKVT